MNRLWPLLLLAACSTSPDKSGVDTASNDPGTTDSASPVDTAPPEPEGPEGRLVIEEFYYSGAAPTEGRDHYFSDQFIKLRNVSDVPVLAGGLLVGDVEGLAGVINPGNTPNARNDDPSVIYFSNLWRVPGAPEDVIVEPGGCLLIAQDAGQHTPYSTIDLWDADFETVIEGGDDTDDAIVPNLESVHFTGGVDWLVTVFGPTIVVLGPLDDDALIREGRSLKVPTTTLVDTVEALMDADSGDFKRLHADLDAGFTYVSGTYTGESVRRVRTADGSLQDTHDSTADFAISDAPDPGCTPL